MPKQYPASTTWRLGSGEGGSYEEALSAWLHAELLDHVGHGMLSVFGPPATPPRVLVLDTAPDSFSAGIPSSPHPHGPILAHLVEAIAGFSGVQVGTILALPRTGAGSHSASGGDYGFLSDLARAIERSFDAWQVAGALEPLILNLSLGWEGCLSNGGCPAGVPPPAIDARAVHDALHVATCAGALVIAAAGNDSGGPVPAEGLMHPASWHSQTVTCPSGDRPLLFAAGGADFAGDALALSRPHGTPPLVALGIGAFHDAASGAAPLPPLLGTSVSAAVVSAVSGAVWSLSEGKDATEIMAFVHGGSAPLREAADDCSPVFESCDVRWVTLCDALSGLTPGVATCTALPSGGTAAEGREGLYVANPPYDEALDNELREAQSLVALSAPIAFELQTAAEIPRYIERAATADGLVFPLPIQPACPKCVFVLSDPAESGVLPELYASLAVDLSAPMLVVESGSDLYGAALPARSVGSVARFPVAVGTLPPSVDRAWITGMDTSGHSVTQQILVHR